MCSWKILVTTCFALFSVWVVAPSAFAQCGVIAIPSLNLPRDQAVESLTPTLSMIPTTHLNQGPNGCVHWKTVFQIATTAGFTNNSIVHRVDLIRGDNDDLTKITLPSNLLRTNTRYYWRVQQEGLSPDPNGPRGQGFLTPSRFSDPRVFTTFPCNLPPVGNGSPEDGASLITAPTLKLATLGEASEPLCSPNFSEWQVATDNGFSPESLVFNSVQLGDHTRFRVPDNALIFNTTYFWRVRTGAITGERSAWSEPSQFKITALIVFAPCSWVPVFNLTPADDAVGVGRQPTLKLEAGVAPVPVCTHNGTQWQVAHEVGFGQNDLVFDSGIDPDQLSSIEVPEGVLEYGMTYFWRARFHSTTAIPGKWSTPTRFTIIPLLTVLESCLWPPIERLSPTDGKQGVSVLPEFKIRLGGQGPAPMNCSLDHFRWQVSIDAGFAQNAVFYDTGDSEDASTQHALRLILLEYERTYYWRVQPLSDHGITNAWSDPGSFTTRAEGGAPGGNPCDFADLGFPVNKSPADGAQGVSLTPTLNILLERPFGGDCQWDATIWIISTDAQMENVIIDSDDDRLNLNAYTLPAGILQPNTTYWWHAFVRDLSGEGIGSGSRATRFTTAGNEQPAGGGIACILDTNRNKKLDDGEMLTAIRNWIQGEPVAGGGGRTLDDDAILDLIRKWIQSEQLDC